MSGHNKWKQIKERKGAQDKKKSQLFGKVLTALSRAARENSNPETNPRLKTLIEQAREQNVPKENVDRALSRAAEAKDLKEIIIEAYGPDSVAILIEAITDNSNRTVNEVRTILNELGAKPADPGSVLWAFTQPTKGVWLAKFPQVVSERARVELARLVAALEEHPDVQKIIAAAQ